MIYVLPPCVPLDLWQIFAQKFFFAPTETDTSILLHRLFSLIAPTKLTAMLDEENNPKNILQTSGSNLVD